MKVSKNKKATVLLVSLVLLLCVAVGGTIAILIDNAGPIRNLFTSSSVTTAVVEDITTVPGTKADVKIQNNGDTEAWIRAAVVVTWQDEDGNVYGQAPVLETDYELTFNKEVQASFGNGQWIQSSDGFYYWTKPVMEAKVEDGQIIYSTTGILITSATMFQQKVVDGVTYSINVEIIGSGIQSVPDRAVIEAWSSGVSGVDTDPESGIRTLEIKE